MDEWHSIAGTDFVWDVDKASSNLAKHGIRFDDAANVFLDPLFVMMDATRNDAARDAVVGFDLHARLLFVVNIECDGEHIRTISARPETSFVEKIYAQ